VNLQNDVSENDPWLYLSTYEGTGWRGHAKPVALEGADGRWRLDTTAIERRAAELAREGSRELVAALPAWISLRYHSEAVRLALATWPFLITRHIVDHRPLLAKQRALAGRPPPAVPPTYGTPPVPIPWQLHHEPPAPAWQRAWNATEFLLSSILEECRRAGIGSIVAIVPARQTVNRRWWQILTTHNPQLAGPAWSADAPRARMVRLLERIGADYVDLTEPLRASLERGSDPYFGVAVHLNASGHRVVADALESPVRRALAERRRAGVGTGTGPPGPGR